MVANISSNLLQPSIHIHQLYSPTNMFSSVRSGARIASRRNPITSSPSCPLLAAQRRSQVSAARLVGLTLCFCSPIRLLTGFRNSAAAQLHATPEPIRHAPKPASTPKSQTAQPTKTAPIADSTFVGMTGGEIFHEMMLRQGVKVVFGYPGGAILPVYDAIYNSDYFDFVLPRHEQGAGHMAEGYARVT